MRFSFITLALILIVASCSNKSPFEGYSLTKSGIHYRLNSFGESEKKVQPGDYVTMDISYYTIYDSLFFSGRRKIKVDKPKYNTGIEACFLMLKEQESASFIISADDFFQRTLETSLPGFLKSGDLIKINIDVVEVQTEKEFEEQKFAFLNWTEDFGDYEKVILQQYINNSELPVQPGGEGIYHLTIEEGTGKCIEIGDTITINYEGRFLNGKFFDSTKKRKQPFQFIYGTEWQVIEGIEKGLGLMCEGEKALLILQSEMGFGNQGATTGIVPPFTSLIYEIEVLKVN